MMIAQGFSFQYPIIIANKRNKKKLPFIAFSGSRDQITDSITNEEEGKEGKRRKRRREGAMSRLQKYRHSREREEKSLFVTNSMIEPIDEDECKEEEEVEENEFQNNKEFQENSHFENNNNKNKNIQKSNSIYSEPALYDLAFGYRDYEAEVQFLIHAHQIHSSSSSSNDSSSNNKPLRILELGAGPARHGITALTTFDSNIVSSYTAIDNSPAMFDYGMEIASMELSSSSSDDPSSSRLNDFEYHLADVRTLQQKQQKQNDSSSSLYDTAWMLLGSMSHMLTTKDILSLFRSVHDQLLPKKNGTFIIELPHPRETFAIMECTKNQWEIPLVEEEEDLDDNNNNKEYGLLRILWGDDNDTFDPITQIRNFTVHMELFEYDDNQNQNQNNNNDIPKKSLYEVVPTRLFTVQEIHALAILGGFELVAMYGALDENVSIDNNDDEAYRLVCVLRTV